MRKKLFRYPVALVIITGVTSHSHYGASRLDKLRRHHQLPDVPALIPTDTAITNLAASGIISGYTNGRLSAQRPGHQQQFAKISSLP